MVTVTDYMVNIGFVGDTLQIFVNNTLITEVPNCEPIVDEKFVCDVLRGQGYEILPTDLGIS